MDRGGRESSGVYQGSPIKHMSFSVVILTHNEESNIEACLASVAFCDDVAILDSGSTDRTVELARARGAAIYTRTFDDFGGQRNWALREIPFKYDHVFHLDADERFTPELARECATCVAADTHSGYFAAGKLMFMGRWIKHASQHPHTGH